MWFKDKTNATQYVSTKISHILYFLTLFPPLLQSFWQSSTLEIRNFQCFLKSNNTTNNFIFSCHNTWYEKIKGKNHKISVSRHSFAYLFWSQRRYQWSTSSECCQRTQWVSSGLNCPRVLSRQFSHSLVELRNTKRKMPSANIHIIIR